MHAIATLLNSQQCDYEQLAIELEKVLSPEALFQIITELKFDTESIYENIVYVELFLFRKTQTQNLQTLKNIINARSAASQTQSIISLDSQNATLEISTKKVPTISDRAESRFAHEVGIMPVTHPLLAEYIYQTTHALSGSNYSNQSSQLTDFDETHTAFNSNQPLLYCNGPTYSYNPEYEYTSGSNTNNNSIDYGQTGSNYNYNGENNSYYHTGNEQLDPFVRPVYNTQGPHRSNILKQVQSFSTVSLTPTYQTSQNYQLTSTQNFDNHDVSYQNIFDPAAYAYGNGVCYVCQHPPYSQAKNFDVGTPTVNDFRINDVLQSSCNQSSYFKLNQALGLANQNENLLSTSPARQTPSNTMRSQSPHSEHFSVDKFAQHYRSTSNNQSSQVSRDPNKLEQEYLEQFRKNIKPPQNRAIQNTVADFIKFLQGFSTLAEAAFKLNKRPKFLNLIITRLNIYINLPNSFAELKRLTPQQLISYGDKMHEDVNSIQPLFIINNLPLIVIFLRLKKVKNITQLDCALGTSQNLMSNFLDKMLFFDQHFTFQKLNAMTLEEFLKKEHATKSYNEIIRQAEPTKRTQVTAQQPYPNEGPMKRYKKT